MLGLRLRLALQVHEKLAQVSLSERERSLANQFSTMLGAGGKHLLSELTRAMMSDIHYSCFSTASAPTVKPALRPSAR